jgi:hypothetical protein
MIRKINNRNDSVLYLKENGLYAKQRDWVMGKTVGVFGGELPDGPNGIKAWRFCLYIHKYENEWAVSDLAFQVSEPTKCGTLYRATEFACKLMLDKLEK